MDLAVDIDRNGLTESLTAVLRSYKKPENSDQARFLRELAEETKGEDPPETLRRFLNWDEAKEMILGGMAIGSHTHSHRVLSQLEPELGGHGVADRGDVGQDAAGEGNIEVQGERFQARGG